MKKIIRMIMYTSCLQGLHAQENVFRASSRHSYYASMQEDAIGKLKLRNGKVIYVICDPSYSSISKDRWVLAIGQHGKTISVIFSTIESKKLLLNPYVFDIDKVNPEFLKSLENLRKLHSKYAGSKGDELTKIKALEMRGTGMFFSVGGKRCMLPEDGKDIEKIKSSVTVELVKIIKLLDVMPQVWPK